jgi:hypothetical protein
VKRLIPLFLVFAVVLSACKIRVEQLTVVNADGSGEVSMIMGFDDEMMSLVSQSGDDPFADLESEIPEGFTVEQIEEEDFTGIRATRPFNSLDEIESVWQDVTEGEATPLTGEEFSITQEGDDFVFRAAFEDLDLGLGEEDTVEGFGFEGIDLDEIFDIRVSIRLPGEVAEGDHNADLVEPDGTLVWRISPTATQRTLEARSSNAGGSLVWLWGLLAAVVVAGGVALLLMMRRRPAPAGPVEAVGAVEMPEHPIEGPPEEPPPVDGDPFAP